jgi:hypothetical protein
MDEGTWNEAAVKAAWAPPPYEGLQRRLDVYSASKTQGEQAAWKWMKDHNPHFVLNTILPNANIGRVLSPEHQGYPSTISWVKAFWDSFKSDGARELEFNPPQYFVNVQDNKWLHVAALIFKDVQRSASLRLPIRTTGMTCLPFAGNCSLVARSLMISPILAGI